MVSLRDAMLFFSTYLFPIAGFPLVAYGWWRATDGSLASVALVLGVPLVLGYVVPGLGSSVLKLWRVTGPWRVGGVYAHHGFIYASKMGFVLLIAVRDPAAMRGWHVPAAVLVCAAATAFGAWWHDVHAVKAGRIEVLARDGRSLDTLLTSHEPAAFLAVGGAYAATCILAFPVLARDPAALWWLFPAGLAAVGVAASLTFLALDPGAFRRTVPRRTTHDR